MPGPPGMMPAEFQASRIFGNGHYTKLGGLCLLQHTRSYVMASPRPGIPSLSTAKSMPGLEPGAFSVGNFAIVSHPGGAVLALPCRLPIVSQLAVFWRRELHLWVRDSRGSPPTHSISSQRGYSHAGPAGPID